MPRAPISVAHPRIWPTVVAVFLVIFFTAIAAFGFQAALSGGNTNGNLKTSDGGNIGNNIQQAFGWDPAKSTYVSATLTVVKTSNNVTISFPKGDHISTVCIFTANKLFDNQGLLNSSSIYNYVELASSGTGNSHSNLTGLFMYVGQQVNSSALTAITDKGVTKSIMNYSIYSSSVNNLGVNVELPIPQLLATPLSFFSEYQIDLSQNSTFNSTSAVSLLFTQYFEHPANWNILFDAEAGVLVTGLVLIGMVYFAVPRHKEWVS